MPEFTITLSQKTVDALTVIVQRENDNTGADLTVAQWLELQPKLAAITPQLAAAHAALQERHQRDAEAALAAAVRATRERLLQEL